MSRGGTKKARAAQERQRKERERAASRAAASISKKKKKKEEEKQDRPKVGKGRAALLHLSGFPAPFVVAFGLVLSGYVARDGVAPTDPYWARTLIGDPNAPYWREPGGLLLAGSVLAVGVALFLVFPISVWRYAYRNRDVVERDRTSVDNAFTMLLLGVVAWVVRIAIGYSTTLDGLATMLVVLTAYVPLFSAGFALVLPPIPGMGRIGGVLPDFMKVPFTERVLLDEEEREEVRASTTAAKAALRAARAERQRRRRK
jgi:hypothetical protein